MKDLYGRGPTHAKTYFCDEYIFCVMSGGMTRDEETMVRGGEHEAVRAYRLRFEAVIAPELIRRVEDVLERKIVSYHSQILFDPDRLIEIFVLDPDTEWDEGLHPTDTNDLGSTRRGPTAESNADSSPQA